MDRLVAVRRRLLLDGEHHHICRELPECMHVLKQEASADGAKERGQAAGGGHARKRERVRLSTETHQKGQEIRRWGGSGDKVKHHQTRKEKEREKGQQKGKLRRRTRWI
ncbi:hypothetical protein M440DRAFT_332543 [Trichoderma longibrachiatum ATCC 18648]|uniref:Uncharacterized protein n=1 Tax=Trichoderma longibrachiatum ATCC 18648 TaxID=983965 RepID=A0A2T4C2Y1_TRILO|nr:hypothetical protein M440DRAFT_332543 [Trichoderma longibrachiatum ATCC 18648]